MSQPDAWPMIRRRAAAAGIAAPIGCHTFRATGITAYLSNGGALEHAQEMAAHESPRTTKLYDRTKERLTRTDQVVNSRIIVKHGARSRWRGQIQHVALDRAKADAASCPDCGPLDRRRQFRPGCC
jgi:hypothetical protein